MKAEMITMISFGPKSVQDILDYLFPTESEPLYIKLCLKLGEY